MVFIFFEIYTDSDVKMPANSISGATSCILRELKELSLILSAKYRYLGFQTDVCRNVTG